MKHNVAQMLSAISCMLIITTAGYTQQNHFSLQNIDLQTIIQNIDNDQDLDILVQLDDIKIDLINVSQNSVLKSGEDILTIDIDCDGIDEYFYTSDTNAGGVTADELQSVFKPRPEILTLEINEVDEPYVFTTNDLNVGYFEGAGIKNDIFYPALAGPGIHAIKYTATTPLGCQGTMTIMITVNPDSQSPTQIQPIDISRKRSTIYIDNPEENPIHVQVFTTSGQLLASQSASRSIEINTNPNYNGIYVVNVHSASGTYTRQLYIR